MTVFRFAQRLSQILQGRNLTAEEVAGLDRYDLEIEDRVDGGGDSFWSFDNQTLYNNRDQTTGITDVVISPETTPATTNTYLTMYDDGTSNSAYVALVTSRSGGQANVFSNGTATFGSDTLLHLYATNPGATTEVRGARYLLLASTDAAADGGVGVDIQALGAGTQLRLLASNGANIQVTLSGGGSLTITGLPTSNPGGTGVVWNSAGTLKIT